jgi:SAM-dependent methyltransferase
VIFRGRNVLDAGCGSGRHVFAMSALGARRVIGVDISGRSLAAGRERIRRAHLTDVVPAEGDILALPFRDDSFDIVHSSGVLHHTDDWRQGMSEMVRVLRPGGTGLLMYLAEYPGGLFWDIIELLRVIMCSESPVITRTALRALAVPPERIIYMLDPVLVPIHLRFKETEIGAYLADLGITQYRRFTRGGNSDRIERVFCGERHAAVKFGVGEHRFVFTKPAGRS